MNEERYLTRKEAAEILRRKPQTLRAWAMRGQGPPFIRVSERVLYPESDLLAWIESRRVEPGPGPRQTVASTASAVER